MDYTLTKKYTKAIQNAWFGDWDRQGKDFQIYIKKVQFSKIFKIRNHSFRLVEVVDG